MKSVLGIMIKRSMRNDNNGLDKKGRRKIRKPSGTTDQKGIQTNVDTEDTLVTYFA